MNEYRGRVTVSTDNMEPSASNAALSADEIPSLGTPVTVRVISYRRYRHDTDGVSVKAVLDGLVAAGILSGDTSEQISSVTFESRKVGSKDDEKTIIRLVGAA